LFEAQEDLVRKKKLAILGQLAGSVGHELRNPLGVMSNAVYYLKTVLPDADETVKEYLNIINSEIDNSQRIISDLLDFSKTKPSQAKLIAVDELIKQSLERCTFNPSISLNVDIPERLPIVKVDPLQLVQVFQNLMTNAVQAMPEGGELRVAARSTRDEGRETRDEGVLRLSDQSGRSSSVSCEQGGLPSSIEISVTDTGEGIKPENMAMLFQPLYTTKARGIGLGLVVSKNLVEANGGRLEAASHLGKGTTFTVILPVEGEMT
jgi:two-component system NtrC family sensor kinase